MPPKEPLELPPVAVTMLSRAPGLAVASVSVGDKGDAIRLLTRSESAHLPSGRIEQAGFASFPRNRAAHPYDAFLSITSVHTTYEIEIRDLEDTFPLIQLLPDGAVLIVSARCRRYPDGTHDLNARIYDSQGQPREEFLLGDGIQHVQADQKGNIWVGYFDEGVYGNYGWGGAGDAAPVGASGLVCFDAKGQKSWEYDPVPGVEVISDVYALNVFGDEAWAYYYSDFPLVRIASDRTVTVWTTETAEHAPSQSAMAWFCSLVDIRRVKRLADSCDSTKIMLRSMLTFRCCLQKAETWRTQTCLAGVTFSTSSWTTSGISFLPILSDSLTALREKRYGVSSTTVCTFTFGVVVITTTLTSISRVPAIVRGPIASPPRKYPTSTATTGFTYAYVPTLVGDSW
jgi:hypothetical protein